MPLIKTFNGQLIKRTKRKGNNVLVCLAGCREDEPNHWIAVSGEAYELGRSYEFTSRRSDQKTLASSRT